VIREFAEFSKRSNSSRTSKEFFPTRSDSFLSCFASFGLEGDFDLEIFDGLIEEI
jgi:hypothetical protein